MDGLGYWYPGNPPPLHCTPLPPLSYWLSRRISLEKYKINIRSNLPLLFMFYNAQKEREKTGKKKKSCIVTKL
jgi:hypothetical protein